jgi:hypothetical protein
MPFAGYDVICVVYLKITYHRGDESLSVIMQSQVFKGTLVPGNWVDGLHSKGG